MYKEEVLMYKEEVLMYKEKVLMSYSSVMGYAVEKESYFDTVDK